VRVSEKGIKQITCSYKLLTMNRQQITEQLTGIFRKTFNDERIVVNDALTAHDVANWDSLTHMLMIGEVENRFAVKFKLKELGRLDNAGSLISLIESKLGKQG
ncbi:MAG TPA: hypothetical protein PLQ40_10810, partial [Ferruginibacter sp.]|nr:hypothetical protein [Ferruginibacter sp.]